MTMGIDRLRFLWEEEVAPPEAVPRRHRESSAGVPRPLLRAIRFVLVGSVATSLMANIIGIRLIAPVDAQPRYRNECRRECGELALASLEQCQAVKLTCQQQVLDALDACRAGCPPGRPASACGEQCLATANAADRACKEAFKTCDRAARANEETCRTTCETDALP